MRIVESQEVGIDATGGGEGQENSTVREEVTAPTRLVLEETAALSPLEEIMALTLTEEAEVLLVEKTPAQLSRSRRPSCQRRC